MEADDVAGRSDSIRSSETTNALPLAPPEREILTIKQLVAYSNLSERTLRGYLHRRVQPLPYFQVAKKILVFRSTFAEWLTPFRGADRSEEIARVVDEVFSSLDLTGPLFFSAPGKAIDERHLYRLWNRTLTRAGVRYREPEQLRHPFASTMLSRNAPILYVAVQGGWKNPGALFRHYAEVAPQVAARAEIKPATPAQPPGRASS